MELTEFGTLGAGVEVDVGQRVEFVDDDVDVVTTDTGGNDCDALAFVGTGHGAEFAALDFAFAVLKVRCDELNSAGIADENHFVCDLFGKKVEVENRTVCVENEFGFGKMDVVHGHFILKKK